ncbi:hypothetical protein [Lysobacter sp. A289]
MNWKLIFIAGFFILLSGVTIGVVESGFTAQSREMVLVKFLGALGAQFLLYAVVFVWLGYRQLHRPLAHAVAAVFVSFIFATLSMVAISGYLSLPATERQPLPLVAIDWAVTAIALAIGLLIGRHWAKRRHSALPSYDA